MLVATHINDCKQYICIKDDIFRTHVGYSSCPNQNTFLFFKAYFLVKTSTKF